MPEKTRSFSPQEAARILTRHGRQAQASDFARELHFKIANRGMLDIAIQPMTPDRARELLPLAQEIVSYLEGEAER